MAVEPVDNTALEQDDRFPSGEWKGFFLMPRKPGRNWMELHLTFQEGRVHGEGRDWVGEFLIRGRYDTADGRCRWTKKYVGKHDVSYQGFNEGKGIWGTWEIENWWRGGFHVWPIAMGDPTGEKLTEEAELPVAVEAGAAVESFAESVR